MIIYDRDKIIEWLTEISLRPCDFSRPEDYDDNMTEDLADGAIDMLKKQKWHFFHVRELTEEEKIEHPDWVSIAECDDYKPNNGEEFLFYRKCFNSIGIDTWDDDMWADYACTGDGENIEDGDAWMELPEKPNRR